MVVAVVATGFVRVADVIVGRVLELSLQCVVKVVTKVVLVVVVVVMMVVLVVVVMMVVVYYQH